MARNVARNWLPRPGPSGDEANRGRGGVGRRSEDPPGAQLVLAGSLGGVGPVGGPRVAPRGVGDRVDQAAVASWAQPGGRQLPK